MRNRQFACVSAIWIALFVGAPTTCFSVQETAKHNAAAQAVAKTTVENTDKTEDLIDHYQSMLEKLRTELLDSIPTVDKAKREAHEAARNAEKAASLRLEAAQKKIGEIETAKALIGHAKGKWIGGADKGIAAANEQLKKATTDAERQLAQEELEKWQKNREDGVTALNERQANFDRLERERPAFEKELNEAKQMLADAKSATLDTVNDLGLDSFLSSDKLDKQLAKFIVLSEATPEGLATFAAEGDEHKQLIETLLSNTELILQMIAADGAEEGRYGQAMKIYMTIRKSSDKSHSGVLQKLALAISLEHAVPVTQRNAENDEDGPEFINPVKRYFHYQNAFLNGELDPCFKNLTTWDLRMVVNGNEPDEILTWGREMLSNYRPDHVHTSDYRWRYVAAVRTDIKYGSQDNKFDKPEQQFFQNILMNGGVCGRRAFFGRFILRSFGIPTTARPQRGHAALAHWTPNGWVVCLGGGWGAGWADGPNKWPSKNRKNGRNSDLDFLATTQARATGDKYLAIKRAQWIGDLLGEQRVAGFNSADPEFWYAVSFYVQQNIINNAGAVTLAPVGEELGEANESRVKYAIESATITSADRKVVVETDGTITLPAVACATPTKSTGKIIFMPCSLGGKQLHYSRTGKPESFEYIFDAPSEGRYELSALVVTPSWKQMLSVTVNDDKTPVDVALPYTVGKWERSQPVEIKLSKGRNVLRFSRQEPVKGVTIKEFSLTPVQSN